MGKISETEQVYYVIMVQGLKPRLGKRVHICPIHRILMGRSQEAKKVFGGHAELEDLVVIK